MVFNLIIITIIIIIVVIALLAARQVDQIEQRIFLSGRNLRFFLFIWLFMLMLKDEPELKDGMRTRWVLVLMRLLVAPLLLPHFQNHDGLLKGAHLPHLHILRYNAVLRVFHDLQVLSLRVQ